MFNIGMENKPYEYTIKHDGIRAPYVTHSLIFIAMFHSPTGLDSICWKISTFHGDDMHVGQS